MYTQVKTIWHAMVELSRTLNRQHTVENFSTINEKLSIESGSALGSSDVPGLSYLCIGRGGHTNVTGTGGASLVNILQHRITDGCLFDQLPFIVRSVTSDLSAAERSAYRLRKVEEHNGENYFVYYGMKIDFSTATPTLNNIDTTGGTAVTTAFVSASSQLTPVAVSVDSVGAPITTSNVSISVTAPLTITLSTSVIAEILAAVEVVYGDPRFATISEIVMCTGVDRTTGTSAGGLTVTYTEAIAVQPASFLGADINLAATSSEVELNYKLGTHMRLLT